MGLESLKETPEYLMKNITVEVSESQLMKDLDSLDPHKLNAFKLKAEEELKGIKTGDQQVKTENILKQSTGESIQKIQVGTGENKINLGSLIDAELATRMIDTLVPALFVLVLRIGAGIKVNKKDLQATPKEMEMMNPIVQKCLEVIEFNINNPFVALGVVMGVVYSTKAAEIGVDKFMSKDSSNGENNLGEKKTRKPRSDAGKKRI